MGVASLWRRLTAPLEIRSSPEPTGWTLAELLADTADPTAAGVTVNGDTAMRHTSVWACVRLLADSVSSLPVHAEQNGQQIDTPRVLVEPGAGVPVSEWVGQVMRCLLLRGNAYGFIAGRAGVGLWPDQVELIHPDRICPIETPDGRLDHWRVMGQPYGPDQIWHVPAFPMPQRVLGLSPITYARQSIGLGLAAERFAGQYFGDNGIPAGVLMIDRDVSPAVAESLLAGWKARHTGRHGIGLLTSGARFAPISVNPEESQFIETQQLNTAQIARVFGVPVEMIAGSAGNSLTYSNSEARALDFVRYSLGPWLVRLEGALSRLLPTGQRARFNADALLRGTTSERYAAHKLALDAGWATVDEVRALEGLPPLPAAPPPAPSEVF